LVLQGIADPGNLGTLIRCAAAFAIRQVVLVGGSDPFAHKVVQASAGELATVALHRFDPSDGLKSLAGGAPCCALMVRAGVDPADLPRRPRWLVVGSEAHGLDEVTLAACAERVTLPMPGGTESLNAAMAGAIACYALFAPRRG
jgi:tRNA G18 (ribose-2'-O)-methylase SpoU